VSNELVGVLDVGKTNVRLAFVDAHSGDEVWSARRASHVVNSPLIRQLDVDGIERWMTEALRSAPRREQVRALVPIAHGAAAVLLDADLKVLVAPDYEDPRFETVAAAYSQVRDPFSHTFSPQLALGLNLGRQLFYLETMAPKLYARVAHVVLYPQYWAWRLSGVLASELTSLGCHTDLWQPRERTYSALAHSHNWSQRLPPIRYAGDTLATIAAEMSAATGLDPGCRIVCGIHDSNASYLQHLLDRSRDRPFTVVSSGTWTVVMTGAADLSRLRQERDMLANVDAFGAPVGTARFMGGREYERIAGSSAAPDTAALANVMRLQALAVPSFAAGGPFPHHPGKILRAERLDATERATLASLYTALMTDLLMDDLQARGAIIIDGPLASNSVYCAVLATLRQANAVHRKAHATGAARASCHLAGYATTEEPTVAVDALQLCDLDRYRDSWRTHLPG